MPEPGGDRGACGRAATVTAPTADEHRGAIAMLSAVQHGAADAEADVGVAPTGGQHEHGRAREHDAHRDHRARRASRRSRAPGTRVAGEHELPPAGVLLAAQQPGGGEERPDRADAS